MSERRMFAKAIVNSDAFLDMPLSTQCLYFHLGMVADDDGFVNNPKSIMRSLGATEEDLDMLKMKKFILAFDSGVIVIKHWRIHNYIRKDRKCDTKYVDEMESLLIDENGAYTTSKTQIPLLPDDVGNSQPTLRQQAYAESELPYSFDYKIRQAFWNTKCPICGKTMSSDYLCKPTIQHNLPISKGGKHELGNISVICQSCNSSIRDKETDSLNADEVIKVWEKICQSLDSHLSVLCPSNVSIGKDSIGKVSIGKSSIDKNSNHRGYDDDEEIEIDEEI